MDIPVDLWFAPLKPGGFRSRSIYLSIFLHFGRPEVLAFTMETHNLHF